ncbi:MAG: nucleotidyl transferase AbiEii/AbiGii toxin family protein [Candidatus Omnitrophota bacterium]|nr:nucleotidyl transferase AbiEii/AbiGii toxin family protein [Candidatus Omnitrophota bacterium]
MKQNLADFQERVLKILSDKIDDFYLAGGTALSLYYFNHRESLDLDFFTHSFNKLKVFEITKFLSLTLKRMVELIAEESRKNRIKILVYNIYINKKQILKVDFIQDYLDLIKPPKLINGIRVLSLEDIYIRKIFAITGTRGIEDSIGRKVFKGGRQEAKDFYDLYCLSHIFMRLSDFSFKYGNQLTKESIIRWFRTYSRFDMKTGLLELQLKKNVDYADIERHFKKEVDKIIEKEVDFI